MKSVQAKSVATSVKAPDVQESDDSLYMTALNLEYSDTKGNRQRSLPTGSTRHGKKTSDSKIRHSPVRRATSKTSAHMLGNTSKKTVTRAVGASRTKSASTPAPYTGNQNLSKKTLASPSVSPSTSRAVSRSSSSSPSIVVLPTPKPSGVPLKQSPLGKGIVNKYPTPNYTQ